MHEDIAYMYVCAPVSSNAHRGLKRGSDCLELEL